MTYQKTYGAWGTPADKTRCCARVFDGFHSHQCRRSHQPNSEYCKTHDPARVAERLAKSQRKWQDRVNAQQAQWHGLEFLRVLRQIAEGHNDARVLAQRVIKKYEKSLR